MWSAAACRRCLPHGLARACCNREPREAAGASPGEEGREQAPALHTALPCRASEACERRCAKIAGGRSPNSFPYFPSLRLRVSMANGLALSGRVGRGAFGALYAVD